MISTSLYFVVFGAAIGSRMAEIEGVSYGAFIVPGLIMLSVLTESISNASFGIYMPRYSGTIYEVLSAPISGDARSSSGYVGAAATKSDHARPGDSRDRARVVRARSSIAASVVDGVVPGAHRVHLQPVRLHHRPVGRAAGRSCRSCPIMVVTPLAFLGGSFYSISMLPQFWQKVALFNPVVYLDQRLPLELLRRVRRRRRREPAA